MINKDYKTFNRLLNIVWFWLEIKRKYYNYLTGLYGDLIEKYKKRWDKIVEKNKKLSAVSNQFIKLYQY